jgi:hypothetical protein
MTLPVLQSFEKDQTKIVFTINQLSRQLNSVVSSTGGGLGAPSTTFASLPTGTTGTIACVTDSTTATFGAVIAGGGFNTVLAWYNGTSWTVIGI